MRLPAPSPATNKRKVTLRSEILGGAFLIPLTLLLALGAITYFLARSTRTEEALRSLETVAIIQEHRIEAYIDSGASSFALITSRTSTKTAIDDYQLTRNPALRSQAVKTLYDGVTATTDFTSVTVFDSGLQPLMYAGSIDSQPTIPPEFLATAGEGLANGLVVVSDGGEPVNLIGGPLYIDDELIGVAVAGQSMEALYELTGDTTGLADTGETILVQEIDGEIVPISPLRFEPETAETPVLDGLRLNDAVAGIASVTTEATDYHGESVVAFSRHIDGADWGMVVLQDSGEIVDLLNTNTAVIGAAVLIGVLLAFFAARRVANSVTAPVIQVAENAQQVMQGRRDLTVETDLSEIACLVDSFNTMVSEMDKLTGDLEEKIEARTEVLETKNAELQKVMDDKEVFLAGVSHELRSPITAMIGFIDIVNMSGDELEPGERAEMLETVSSQASDVLNLIEDLLASARAQAGTLKVAAVRVNLAAQARQVIEATSASSRKTVRYAGGEGNALGDPARVRQIVRNLVTNSFRYGGPEIEVEIHVEGNVAILEVKDNGDGVAVDALEKIFEAYGQADPSNVADSVGLGLHVSRNLARLMGGDLDYEYRDGWSVFSLRLLRYSEDESEYEGQPIVVSLGNE